MASNFRALLTALVLSGGGLFGCESPFASGTPQESVADGPTLADPSGAAGGTAPTKTSPQPLPLPEGFYPRAILRSSGSIVASVVRGLPSKRMGVTFLESTNGGGSFTEIGQIDDPANSSGLCCGTLFELPKALGALSAGTLLWAASRGADATAPMSIPVWKSDDGGRKWTYLSTVVTGAVGRKQGGIWEPEFSMTEDGALVCHWSDETDPSHSQKLMKARSTDGVSWTGHSATVSLGTFGYRPGMPNVRRSPRGPYVMTYEICGLPNDHCTAFLRTSEDGWNWGDPANKGRRVTTPDGKHFRHAPTLAWTSADETDSGRFIMVGQMAYDANGAVAAESGKIVLANTEGTNGFWYPIAAPVPVPSAADNFCPNYSSTILPLENGKVALEIASQWDGKVCRSYFARSPLVDTSDGTEITDGGTYRLVNSVSGQCLDAGGSLQQADCKGSDAQRWTVSRSSDGTVSLRTAAGSKCLAVAGDPPTAGTNIDQAACGGAGQSWKLRGMGVGYYEIMKDSADICLDVANHSTAAGASVQVWSCGSLSSQLWRFDKL